MAALEQYSPIGWREGCCLANVNQSQFAREWWGSCPKQLTPLGQGGGTVQFEIVPVAEVALQVEMVVVERIGQRRISGEIASGGSFQYLTFVINSPAEAIRAIGQPDSVEFRQRPLGRICSAKTAVEASLPTG